MNAQDYAAAQADVGARLGIAKNASTLLEEWIAFVDECEECYSWDVSEYDHEIAVRDRLASILEAPELQRYDEHRELRQRVGRVDTRFQSLLIPGIALPAKRSWWRAGVLQRAGSDYAQFFRDAHGIEVEVCEP